jgi:hypothetical protein
LKQPFSLRDGQNVTEHEDGGCRVDEEGSDLLIRKIGGYRKQTFSGNNGIVGPVAAFLSVNNRDTLSRPRTIYLRTENIYDANPFKSGG